MDASQAGTKTQFSEKMEFEYKSLFASVGAKYEKKGGESVKQETKSTSTAIEAKGGSQDIASILSDFYAPTFKTEFKEWLQSIPQYPKAFKFQMSSTSDLVNFRANDLFPNEKVCSIQYMSINVNPFLRLWQTATLSLQYQLRREADSERKWR